MTDCCPHCGHPLTPDDPLAERAAQLEADCRAGGLLVLPGGRVREDVAALLLGRRPGTLRNWASGDQRLPFERRAGRRIYALADIARLVEGER